VDVGRGRVVFDLADQGQGVGARAADGRVARGADGEAAAREVDRQLGRQEAVLVECVADPLPLPAQGRVREGAVLTRLAANGPDVAGRRLDEGAAFTG